MKAEIIGLGSYIPKNKIPNTHFLDWEFYNDKGEKFDTPNEITIEKFKAITGIEERRWLDDDMVASDMAVIAAKRALDDSGINPDDLDYIIAATNFGDVEKDNYFSDFMPAVASRIKHRLGLANPKAIAFDVIFGCPGWLQALIMSNQFMKAGDAKYAMIVGVEALSRVIDPFDRDAMIFADGSGVAIVKLNDEENGSGIVSYKTVSHAHPEAELLYNGQSFNKEYKPEAKFIKMQGHKIYEYALNEVPSAMKVALDESGYDIDDVKKIFIHQANEKMDAQIVKRFYRLYKKQTPENIMPMNINKLGNSSVATIPTLMDMVRRGDLPPHELHKGDIIILASVGAGMNINAAVMKY
ncbi:MAG TPA: ketoacyl-ACP synthase III [Flavobacteriales bacterium]|nr:ketoacyl-ACP synthase III [Flavobacteriales bacterium]